MVWWPTPSAAGGLSTCLIVDSDIRKRWAVAFRAVVLVAVVVAIGKGFGLRFDDGVGDYLGFVGIALAVGLLAGGASICIARVRGDKGNERPAQPGP
jgi:hypothetical protein